MINLSSLSCDEKRLLRRLEDLSDIAAAKQISRFSFFLNERQVLIAEGFIGRIHAKNTMLFGGYAGAARRVCGFFPYFDDPSAEGFPIVPFTARFPKDKSLSHRDFLGSLMGLGVKRESVGDISAGEGVCTFFTLEGIAAFVGQELKKIGNTGITLSQGFDEMAIKAPKFIEIKGTVSSPRLDSLVKLITGLSREKAAALIKGGLIMKNHTESEEVSESFLPGDILSVRGYGKFSVGSIGTPTKKGRLPVCINKYI